MKQVGTGRTPALRLLKTAEDCLRLLKTASFRVNSEKILNQSIFQHFSAGIARDLKFGIFPEKIFGQFVSLLMF